MKTSRPGITLPDRALFIRAAAARPWKHRASDASMELEDREPARNVWAMFGMGAFVIGFCAVALFAFPDTSSRGAALAGTLIFGPIGVGLILGGVNAKLAYVRLRVSGDRVSRESRNLFGRRAFDEPLSSYLCILPRALLHTSDRELAGAAHYARLVHASDPERDAVLLVHFQDEAQMILDAGGERGSFEALARTLDLPLATVSADGSVAFRNPDMLDRPLAAGPIKRLAVPTGSEALCPSRKYRIAALPDGFVATRTHPVYLVPFAGLAAATVLAVRFLALTDAGYNLPLVLGAFALFMLAFALTRSRLTLSGGELSLLQTVAWFRVQERRVPLSGIEELDIVHDPLLRRSVLRIASDAATISWAEGEPAEVQAWFRDAILRRLPVSGAPGTPAP